MEYVGKLCMALYFAIHMLSLTVNIYGKSKCTKHLLKLRRLLTFIYALTELVVVVNMYTEDCKVLKI